MVKRKLPPRSGSSLVAVESHPQNGTIKFFGEGGGGGMDGFMLHTKNLRNSLNLKCLCFPILFSYYGNPLFPSFGNCMD